MNDLDLKEIISQLLNRVEKLERAVCDIYGTCTCADSLESNNYIRNVLNSIKDGE